MHAAATNILGFKPAMLAAAAAQFPKTCTVCGRVFATLNDFFDHTTLLGKPRFDDDESDSDVIGALSFANCKCDGTLAIVIEDTSRHAEFNRAVRSEATRTCRSVEDILSWMAELVADEARILAPLAPAQKRSDPTMLALCTRVMTAMQHSSLHVPAYPSTALKLRELISSGSYGTRQLCNVVSHDQSLALAVLRLANSSLFHRGAEITSLSTAVSRIGAWELERLALSSAMAAHSTKRGPLAALRRHFWHRSVTTALLARKLALERGLPYESAFACGLVHEIAGLVMTLNIELMMAQHADFAGPSPSQWLRVIELFATDAGRAVATAWKLSPLLAEAVTSQREDAIADSPHSAMLRTVIAAKKLSLIAGSTPIVTLESLAPVSHLLSASEQQMILRVLPECPETIAGLEHPTVSAPAASTDAKTRRASGAKAADACTILEADASSLKVRSRVALLENFLKKLTVDGDPPLQLWAKTSTCVPSGDGYEITLHLFALDGETECRWRRFLRETSDDGRALDAVSCHF